MAHVVRIGNEKYKIWLENLRRSDLSGGLWVKMGIILSFLQPYIDIIVIFFLDIICCLINLKITV